MTGKAYLLGDLVVAEHQLKQIRELIVRHAQRRAADHPQETHIPLWAGYPIAPAELMVILSPELDVPIYPPRPGVTGTCEGCYPDGNQAGRADIRAREKR